MPSKSGIVLRENETIALEIESRLYITSACVILRFIFGVIRIFLQILGFKKKGFLVISDKRFAEVYTQTIFWFINFGKTIRNVPLKSIKSETGCVWKGTFLFLFRSWQVWYERQGRRVYYILKGLDETEAQKITSILGEYAAGEHAVANTLQENVS